MRLSSIKLAGFKSFVEPTKIPFPDPMTCVVGPNGCGKSNVIDAVRWVLGESSAKNLRGDAMTDVIFNGSTNRKAISQASVELVFDNAAGKLPGTLADRTQVAIKRLVTRDGQSLYFLNGSKCRKRDITDIFLGTGLGPRSYAIIEQGMISRLIESKPQELRVFLEEAAGVSKYKERRRETQTRIKSTRENLERLLDMRQELQAQLDKLALQAEDAKAYRSLKAQERTLKGELAVLKWQALHQKQQQKSEQIAKLTQELDFFNNAHGGHDDVLASLEGQVAQINDGVGVQQQSIHATHTELTRSEQQKIHLLDKLRALQEALDKQQQTYREAEHLLAQQKQRVEEYYDALQQSTEEMLVYEAQYQECEQSYQSLLERFAELEARQHALQTEQSQAQQQHHQAQQNLSQAQQSLNHEKEKYQASLEQLKLLELQNPDAELAQQRQSYSSKAQSMARLQSQAKEFSERAAQLQAQQQQLQQRFQSCQSDYANCIANINALTQVLSEHSTSDEESYLNTLRVKPGYESVVERALLGLTELKQAVGESNNAVWPSETQPREGSVATMVESGCYPDLLNHIQLLESNQSYQSDGDWLMAVDRQGTLYGKNWRAGITDTQQGSGVLLQHAKLRELEQQRPELEQQQQQVQSELAEITEALRQSEHRQLQNKDQIHQLAQDMASAQTRIDMLKEQVVQWQEQCQMLREQQQQSVARQHLQEQKEQQCQQALMQCDEHLAQLEQESSRFSQQFADAKHAQQQAATAKQKAQQHLHDAKLVQQQTNSDWQLSQSKAEHLQNSLEQGQERLQELLEEQMMLQEPLAEADEKIAQLLATQQAQQQVLEQLQQQLAQAKCELQEKQASLKSAQSEVQGLNEKLQQLKLDEQGLMIKAQAALEPLQELQQNLKSVLEQLSDDAQQGAHQAKLNKVSQNLSELGAVNLAAIDEFEQAKSRKEYLDTQLDDLTAALDTLEGAIKKIDRETKTRFKSTFDQVNEDLAELFPKVFGGGSAYLELTSDDLLESGVSIMARPPGKKNSTIHLLSGGEKALTALSLVFSIFRLNPAPFCMLDEVDAPLDDANVGRFCRLVEEMSQTVQFIYISHNKIAMEMAGRLTGVTMAEPGVSRMVAVDIEQAVQMAQA
ncbi:MULTISPECIES: chromosome segregation SMC family protein [Pseudoalteromonas]|uniref:Chromosome partition protein Smc n=1 Tax=Pseudoalteromonas amylolytica TaxID=1859457 RepID=A0A1S1MQ11_9GAMM|nr:MULTISPECIES: AAA family ATPase [Pseudoalteromonas]OHU85781.1 chromosome segregation protein SMC [Pseudoalteromonas sp. JW3]OHU87317.1 chromosome segregation protein SMC [Pseudoalteromonas amylolytica]